MGSDHFVILLATGALIFSSFTGSFSQDTSIPPGWLVSFVLILDTSTWNL